MYYFEQVVSGGCGMKTVYASRMYMEYECFSWAQEITLEIQEILAIRQNYQTAKASEQHAITKTDLAIKLGQDSGNSFECGIL